MAMPSDADMRSFLDAGAPSILSNASASLTNASACSTCVKITSQTWSRDSHDLYDFEARVHPCSFTVRKSVRCIRQGTEVQMLDDQEQNPPDADILLRVKEQCGRYWVDKASMCTNAKKLWLLVRNLKNDTSEDGCCLAASDVIKLGRFKFKIRQLVSSTSSSVQPELKMLTGNSAGDSCIARTVGVESTTCRICLLEGATEDDPLIAPCNCKGSIEHVHLKCIRHWIKGRMNIADSPTGSYFFRPLACELCKGTYPMYVDTPAGGGAFTQSMLMELPQTQAPFIVLENQVRDTHVHSNRGLHVLSLAGKALRLGRGHESDVRIADVSISRHHATIRYHEGQFLLQDNNSKFGTLVAVKKPQQVEASRPLWLQIGRTVLSLHAAVDGPKDVTVGDAIAANEMSL